MNKLLKKISFDDILPVWQNKLWAGRTSPIETHSAIVFPSDVSVGDNYEYDISVFDNPVTFWGVYIDNKLVGVNSGHATSDTDYRSRGIWVDPDSRRLGISELLFNGIVFCAIMEKKSRLWSMPRKTALPAYEHFGFSAVGDFFGTETSDQNIYAVMQLP